MCHHCQLSASLLGNVSRRDLFAAAGIGVAGLLLDDIVAAGAVSTPAAAPSPASQPVQPLRRDGPLTVRACFLRPREKYWLGWPGTAWDPDAFAARARQIVGGFAQELGMKVTFEPQPLCDAAAVEQFIASVKSEPPAGVLIFPLHMQQWPSVEKIQQAVGVPAIIFAALGQCFTGHIKEISRRPGVYLASSADFELKPVRFGLKILKARDEIARTRIAVVRGEKQEDRVLDPFGLHARVLPRRIFPQTLATIEVNDEVRALAEDYRRRAQKVIEPSDEDLLNAARNYFCARMIMRDHDCQGITMDCLGLVTDRQIPTPPCMAWCRLLDEGLLGVCEADLNAVMSELLCIKLLDKPGFIQDPVPETVRNTFIGAHCVCATKLNGYDQPAEPFILRSHAESDIGVSLQVIFRQDQPITLMQMAGPSKMWLGRGRVLRNLDTPPAGGCRTSVELALENIPDSRDVKGFHQLFIYGDHVRDFQAYAQVHGIATEPI